MIIAINYLFNLRIVLFLCLSIHIDGLNEVILWKIPLLLLLLLKLRWVLFWITLDLHKYLAILFIFQINQTLFHFFHLISISIVHFSWLPINICKVVTRCCRYRMEIANLAASWNWFFIVEGITFPLGNFALLVHNINNVLSGLWEITNGFTEQILFFE